MKKEIIEYRLISDSRRPNRSQESRFTWGDIKKLLKDKNLTLQDDDIIMQEFSEAYYEEDTARDNFYDMQILRKREETDKELSIRIEREESNKIMYQKRRYENYLKLKKEFEDEKQ